MAARFASSAFARLSLASLVALALALFLAAPAALAVAVNDDANAPAPRTTVHAPTACCAVPEKPLVPMPRSTAPTLPSPSYALHPTTPNATHVPLSTTPMPSTAHTYAVHPTTPNASDVPLSATPPPSPSPHAKVTNASLPRVMPFASKSMNATAPHANLTTPTLPRANLTNASVPHANVPGASRSRNESAPPQRAPPPDTTKANEPQAASTDPSPSPSPTISTPQRYADAAPDGTLPPSDVPSSAPARSPPPARPPPPSLPRAMGEATVVPASSSREGDTAPKATTDSMTARVLTAPASVPAATVALAAASTIGFGATLVAFALYHRLRGSAMLSHETRRRIYDAARSANGITANDAGVKVGVTTGTASYHLDRLVEEGLLAFETSRGAHVYFAYTSENNPEMRKARAAITNDTARRVLEAVVGPEHGAPSRASLSRALGVSATTIAWHLDTLVAAGLVEKARCGRATLVRATELGRNVLAPA